MHMLDPNRSRDRWEPESKLSPLSDERSVWGGSSSAAPKRFLGDRGWSSAASTEKSPEMQCHVVAKQPLAKWPDCIGFLTHLTRVPCMYSVYNGGRCLTLVNARHTDIEEA